MEFSMCDERTFQVHSRCVNCGLLSAKQVSVPVDAEDAPSDIEEFLSSAALANTPFMCRRCDSSIAVIVAVTLKGSEAA